MNWKVEPFGELDGRPVEQITLKNSAQCSMQLLAYGATLRSFVLPSGLDVCLGYDTFSSNAGSNAVPSGRCGKDPNWATCACDRNGVGFFGAARHWKSHRRRAGIAPGRLRSRVRAVRKRRSFGREPVLPAHRRSFNGSHQHGQRTAVYGWRPCAAPRETRRRIWAIFGHLSGNPAVPKRHTGTRISLSTTACRRAISAPVVLPILLVTGDGEPTKLFAPV